MGVLLRASQRTLGALSEVMEMWHAYRQHGRVAECIKVFKWVYMLCFIISQTIYLQLLIAMDCFDMAARYHIYESLSGHDEFGTHVNWLQLHNEGKKLSEFEQKLGEFTELLKLKSDYQLFTALTIITALVQVLKLMDFHPDIGMVTRTVRQGGTDLLNFVGLLITIVFMYAMMGHIIFGSSLASFSKVTNSLRTCFVMMMGDTDFNNDLYTLGESYETVAFLAIIVSAMDEVKAKSAGEEKADLFSDIGELTAFYAETVACVVKRLLKRQGLLQHSPLHGAISEPMLYVQLQSWQDIMRPKAFFRVGEFEVGEIFKEGSLRSRGEEALFGVGEK
eukprot:gene703-1161_t